MADNFGPTPERPNKVPRKRSTGFPESLERRKAVPTVGRRNTDITAENLITKKLVVITVVIVDVLYLACDAAFTTLNRC
jgi:hypothetical protein